MRIWSTDGKTQEAVLDGHGDTISCLAITKDNKYIFSGSYDGSVRIWNLQEEGNKRKEYVLRITSERIHSLAVTSGNKYIVSELSDSIVSIWRVNSMFRNDYRLSKILIL